MITRWARIRRLIITTQARIKFNYLLFFLPHRSFYQIWSQTLLIKSKSIDINLSSRFFDAGVWKSQSPVKSPFLLGMWMAIKSPYFNSVRYWEYRIWRNNIFLQSSSEREKKEREWSVESNWHLRNSLPARYPKNQPQKNFGADQRFWIKKTKSKRRKEEDLEEDQNNDKKTEKLEIFVLASHHWGREGIYNINL